MIINNILALGILAAIFYGGAVQPSNLIAAAPPDAQIKVNYAGINDARGRKYPTYSNVRAGDRLSVGMVGSTYANGAIKGSIWDWGVKEFKIHPNSAISIKSYGRAVAGGRILELTVRGKADVGVRYLTQSSSQVKLCFKNRGCMILRSAAKVNDLPDGRVVVGLVEGHGILQDILEKTTPVTLRPNEYSVMSLDGSFSPARRVKRGGNKPYRVVLRTESTRVLEAEDGYELVAGRYAGQRLQLPYGIEPQIRSPLD